MTQISIRIPDELLDEVDRLATGTNQAERIRWIIEQGLNAVDTKVELEELRHRLHRIEEGLNRSDGAIQRAVDASEQATEATREIQSCLPRGRDGTAHRLMPATRFTVDGKVGLFALRGIATPDLRKKAKTRSA